MTAAEGNLDSPAPILGVSNGQLSITYSDFSFTPVGKSEFISSLITECGMDYLECLIHVEGYLQLLRQDLDLSWVRVSPGGYLGFYDLPRASDGSVPRLGGIVKSQSWGNRLLQIHPEPDTPLIRVGNDYIPLTWASLSEQIHERNAEAAPL